MFNLDSSTSFKSSNIDFRAPSNLPRVVATMGRVVVRRRCRVRVSPIPRFAGDTRAHGAMIPPPQFLPVAMKFAFVQVVVGMS